MMVRRHLAGDHRRLREALRVALHHGARPVRALLFDLGGVIVDIDFGRAIGSWAASAGCEPGELRERFAMDSAYQEHERGRLDIGGYLAALRTALRVSLTDEDLLRGWNSIFLEPVPGILDVLAAARRRLQLYAFTNSNPTHQEVWQAHFAEHLAVFEEVFISSDLGLRKPQVEAYQAVARRMGVAVSEILFFDDTEENVAGALRAGMQAVHFATAADAWRALEPLGIVPS